MRLRLVVVLFSVVGAASACEVGGSNDESDPNEGPCGDLSRADDYEVGLTKIGENGMQVTFVDASPAPPFRSDNTWLVMVEAEDGTPIDDAQWEVFPWMPDHGHGTGVVALVEPGEDAGLWTIDPLNLHMAGLWTIELTVKPTAGQQDTVKFAFCIP